MSAYFGVNKLACTLSTWYCVPEWGMKDFEILLRASAFLIKANPTPAQRKFFPNQFHVVTASHAAAPWRWPKLYPEDWLKEINETHTVYTIESRHEEGNYMCQVDLLPRSFHHVGGRDLAVLHISAGQEDQMLTMLRCCSIEQQLELLLDDPADQALIKDVTHANNSTVSRSDAILPHGQEIYFHGHNILSGADEEEAKLMPAAPHIAKGVIQGKSSAGQTFAKTFINSSSNSSGEVLSVGMCGGPVIVNFPRQESVLTPAPSSEPAKVMSNRVRGGKRGKSKRRGISVEDQKAWQKSLPLPSVNNTKYIMKVAGLLEGIVPVDSSSTGTTDPLQEVRGSAVFVEAPEIRRFINSVESYKQHKNFVKSTIKPEKTDEMLVLSGGESLFHVGYDQDPDKMDLNKILK